MGAPNRLLGWCRGDQSFRFSYQRFLPPSGDTAEGPANESSSTHAAPVKSFQSWPPSLHQAHIPPPGMSLIFHPELQAVGDKAVSCGRGVWLQPPTLSHDCHRRSLKNEPCHFCRRRVHNCGLIFPRGCLPCWTGALLRAAQRRGCSAWSPCEVPSCAAPPASV